MVGVQYDTIYMRGGWNMTSPTLELASGSLRDVQNFEISDIPNGGYRRVSGYERFDGRASPSDATFTLVQIASYTNVPTVGQTLTGGTSGTTGVILVVAATYMVLTAIVGSGFTTTEAVTVGATPIATLIPSTTTLTAQLVAQYKNLAADYYRALIGAVPGSGPVRGVIGHITSGVDVVYAFRNNAGGTAVDIYKTTAGGWVQVPLYREISFTAGAVAVPADGATLVQGANSALIKRVVLESGSWLGGTAAGRLVIATPAPGEFIAGAATIGTTTLTLSGASTAIVISPSGRYDFDIGNFFGQASSIRIYGCDGVNRGFEFDGDVYVPIVALPGNPSLDKPTHVKIHKLHLFFSFSSSAIHSGIGFPYKWTATDGASELGCGDDVTNFLNQPGSASTSTLGITTRSNTLILYGSSVTTWNLTSFNTGVGGIPFTGHLMNESFWFDSVGVRTMKSAQDYGNFSQATLTWGIQPYVASQIDHVYCSVLSRTKNQYRLMFSNGEALVLSIINGKFMGQTKSLYTHVMYSAHSGTATTKEERVFCGANSDGYVYQMDKGSSFDGGAIDAYMVFNWNSLRTPRLLKRFRRGSIEIQGSTYADFTIGYSLGYGSEKYSQPTPRTYASGITGIAFWDQFTWDAFTWDGSDLAPSDVRIAGTAQNIQITLRCGTDYIDPFTFNSFILHYSGRRGLR